MQRLSSKEIINISCTILNNNLGKEIKFPIPIRDLLPDNLNIKEVDFKELYEDSIITPKQKLYEQRSFKCTAISQLAIRTQIMNPGQFAGTIYLQKDLDENSKRFAIAYEFSRFMIHDKKDVSFICDLEPNLGLYDFTSEEDFLATEFSRALLLPYDLVCKEKTKYQSQGGNLPIDYSNWIIHLRDLAQIPEYQAVLAYETIRKVKTMELNGCK